MSFVTVRVAGFFALLNFVFDMRQIKKAFDEETP
jgi:hypothetical protein